MTEINKSKENLIKAIDAFAAIFHDDENPDDVIPMTVNQLYQMKQLLEHAKNLIIELDHNQCSCSGGCGCR